MQTLLPTQFPPLLKDIASLPKQLFVLGKTTVLTQPQIAIVGSRNPSPAGIDIAQELGFLLAKAGLVVTSGLAMGVDTAAHQGALAAKQPTVAVLANGLDQIYPRRNKELAAKIVENGAIVSEFPEKTPPKREHFPQRNRIISGLSLGTVVVEAAPRSGSLITARFAIEQNREVFAVPGSLRNPLSLGCHQLIQQGAHLVTDAQDIVHTLNSLGCWQSPHIGQNLTSPAISLTKKTLEKSQQLLLECVRFEATSIDLISIRSGLPISEVAAKLLKLEITGYINKVGGGYMRVR